MTTEAFGSKRFSREWFFKAITDRKHIDFVDHAVMTNCVISSDRILILFSSFIYFLLLSQLIYIQLFRKRLQEKKHTSARDKTVK